MSAQSESDIQSTYTYYEASIAAKSLALSGEIVSHGSLLALDPLWGYKHTPGPKGLGTRPRAFRVVFKVFLHGSTLNTNHNSLSILLKPYHACSDPEGRVL